jgi:MoaA/NifB/PqqE/SkfB family radical SAM enzyme
MGSYLISAVLFNWGEPLLHPQLPEIVRLFHQNRIFTSVSSNLNIATPDVLAALCEAGLDHLLISVSGASQEVYEKYHRKGQLQLLLDNLKFVTDYKHRHHLSNPVIEIKYLIFSFNRHEVKAAAHLSKFLGADSFLRVAGGGSPAVEVSPANKSPRMAPFWHCSPALNSGKP